MEYFVRKSPNVICYDHFTQDCDCGHCAICRDCYGRCDEVGYN